MSLIPVGYSQVNLLFTGVGAGRGAQVTFGVKNSAPATPATVGAAVNAAMSSSSVMTSVSSSLTYIGCIVKNGPNSTGALGGASASIPGGGNVNAVPPNVCYLFQKNTAAGGRRNRGHMYWPGPPENAIDSGGNLDPTIIGPTLTNFEAFRSALATAGYDMVLLHGDGGSPTTVTSFGLTSKVATQRRRLRK